MNSKMVHNYDGTFISFEGGEGSGKTTQIKLVNDYLMNHYNLEVIVTRQPGGTPLGSKIRSLLVGVSDDPPTPLAELFLYQADRAHHIETVIIPALSRGYFVLTDRYADSSEAYQGYARELYLNTIRKLNQLSTNGLYPDLTFYLDIKPEIGLERSLQRENSKNNKKEVRFEQEALNFHYKVRQGFLDIARREPERVKIINANQPINEVFKDIRHYIDILIKEKYCTIRSAPQIRA